MSSTLEIIVIGVVVAVALAWALRAGWRSMQSKGGCTSCGSEGECPLVGDPDALAELSGRGQLTNLDSCQPGTPSCQELVDSLEKESSSKTP